MKAKKGWQYKKPLFIERQKIQKLFLREMILCMTQQEWLSANVQLLNVWATLSFSHVQGRVVFFVPLFNTTCHNVRRVGKGASWVSKRMYMQPKSVLSFCTIATTRDT